jgi:phage terminase large subunit
MGQIELVLDKPYPKQIEFFKATNKYIAYGGARGGGKSWSARTKAVLLALNYPGIQILLLRRGLTELRENHVIPLRKLLKTDSPTKIAQYKEQSKEFIFPNASRIVLGYCANEGDVLQYQGQAYDVIFLEEATQFTEFQFQTLTESNRSSGLCKTPFKPRMYFTCNPGGVGHMWFKRLFIDKEYRNSEKEEDYIFIQSLVYENKYLMDNDPDYVRALENLPEDRRKAMLYGDWNVFEGQYFGEFRNDIHVIDQFKIPSHWKRYISMDYGLDMLAVLWYARDTEGNAYVYKEIHEPNLIISEAAKKIKQINNGDKYEYIYAPRDLWNRRQETGKSVADIFYENGLQLTKTSVDRVDGWLATKEWLKVIDTRDLETGEPVKTSRLKIFRNCNNLIKNLPQVQIDEKNPNDVATEPHEPTHICDALRYFCVNFTYSSVNPPLENIFNFNFEKPKPNPVGRGDRQNVI